MVSHPIDGSKHEYSSLSSQRGVGEVTGRVCFTKNTFQTNFHQEFLEVYVLDPAIRKKSKVIKVDMSSQTVVLSNGTQQKSFAYQTIDNHQTLCFNNIDLITFFL